MRRLLTVALLVVASMNVGCSTRPAADKDEQSTSASWWAYESCLRKYGSARAAYCDRVSDTNSMSYNDYSYGSQGQGGIDDGTGYLKASPVTQEQRDEAYRAYVESLDEDTQTALTEKWNAL